MLETYYLRESLVLLTLEELETRNLAPIREYEFHQLVRKIQPQDQIVFRYIDEPISYSYDLSGFIEMLERKALVDNFILINGGLTRTNNYQLTRVGRAEARDWMQDVRLRRDLTERIRLGIESSVLLLTESLEVR